MASLPLCIVEEMPWTFLHLFFLFFGHLHLVFRNRQFSDKSILGECEANHFEFQIYRHKWRRFRSEEGNTNLKKFFHCDENVEIYREMRLWSVPCIGCSSSCFGVLYATTVDWQMIQRYLRHLSFYSAPSCLNEKHCPLECIFTEYLWSCKIKKVLYTIVKLDFAISMSNG